MDLNRRRSVKNWSYETTPENKKEVKLTVGGKEVKLEEPKCIIENIMYWRKANQIHKFFIDECADGNDECNIIDVSCKHLEDLLDRCNKIIKATKLSKGKVVNGQKINNKTGEWEDILEDGKVMNKEAIEIAKDLLPTQEGFFFGSTDYDQWYYEDILETKQMLDKLMSNDDWKEHYYEYEASW